MNLIGKIIHGRGIERNLGFPTANIRLNNNSLGDGLYIADTSLGPVFIWRAYEPYLAFSYFIRVDIKQNLYGKIINFKNVVKINLQRTQTLRNYLCNQQNNKIPSTYYLITILFLLLIVLRLYYLNKKILK